MNIKRLTTCLMFFVAFVFSIQAQNKTQEGISLLFTGWNTAVEGGGTDRAAGSTFTMGTTNVILYAQWSVLRGTGPAGGLIFYDKGSVSDGWRYLETAPALWNGGAGDPFSVWITGDGTQTTLNGNTLATIGKGRANTNYMIAQTDYTGGAAKVCDDYSVTPASVTYNDWFLPSKDELDKMWINLKKGTDENSDTYTPVDGFVGSYYWSSSESSANNAWNQSLASGNPTSGGKSLNSYVRAVRAFRSTAPTYIVNYNTNGATEGTVPSDTYSYEPVETVTVLGNTGSLVKTQDGISLLFTGWNTAVEGGGTDRAAGSTFTMGTTNVILYAQWSVLRGTGPAGGLIFYDKGSVSGGWRYLEAAPTDQSIAAAWGTYNYTVAGADGTAIGTGKQNTLDIIAVDSAINKAANECSAYSIVNGGVTYDDWFLPSQEELNKMYVNLKKGIDENSVIYTPVGGFVNFYWSSSEYSADNACTQKFDSGAQYGDGKYNTYRVRAVRAFRSIEPSYIVNYNTNGATGGTVPSDTCYYELNDTVTVLGNTGSLVKIQDGISLLFTGWNTTADGSGTGYIEAGTFNMGSANVILYVQWSVLRGTGPAGGLIFYDKGSYSGDPSWRYLEAAPDDQSDGIQWAVTAYQSTSVPVPSSSPPVPGAIGTAIGTGLANTNAIVAQNGAGTTYAAGLARAYNGGGYSDWFLPSKDELAKLYAMKVLGFGGFTDDIYWSSSEHELYTNSAREQNFYNGNQNYGTKVSSYCRVRAVRAF